MTWMADIFSGGVEGVFKGAGSLFKDIRTAITGDEPLTAEQKSSLQTQILTAEAALEKAERDYSLAQLQGQIDIAKIDQASGSNFRGGWRPATGWICALGFGYMALLRPLLPWAIQVAGQVFGKTFILPELPPIETEMLFALLSGMVGLGAMRTYEKVRK